ncbi:MAG: hypothetical protein ACO3TX_05385, partial [Pseudomonadales bacterium]
MWLGQRCLVRHSIMQTPKKRQGRVRPSSDRARDSAGRWRSSVSVMDDVVERCRGRNETSLTRVNNSAIPFVATRNPGGVRFPFVTFSCDERQSPTSEISGLTVHGDLVLCL